MTVRHLLGIVLCLLGAAMGPQLACGEAPADSPSAIAEESSGADMAATGDRRIMMMLDLSPDHYRATDDYGGAAYGGTVSQSTRSRRAREIARAHHLSFVEHWPMPALGIDCVVLRVPDGRSIDAVIAELSAAPGVAWSQRYNEFRMQGGANPSPGAYNDRLFAAQPVGRDWHLASLHRVATGRGVTIAVVDSRIDTSHPDLAGQIAGAEDFAPAHAAVAERHGTGVAGIIAARANNSMGIVGVAPGARVLGLRACWERSGDRVTVCDSLSLARALTFALERHVDIINLSLSGPNDRLLQTLIGMAVARGITVVAAIDQSRAEISFPASVVGVIAVGDERLSPRLPLGYKAPGLDVPTTEPGGKWGLVNGSSYAAAHVSGLSALLRQLARGHPDARQSAGGLGRVGTIDACAVIARASPLDERGCRSDR